MRGVFANILTEIPREELVFDDLSFAVSQQIYGMLKRRGVSQKRLAELIGCSEPAVSKHLSGDTNLTLKTIAKMLAALSAEMKIAVVDAGAEGFWHRKFNTRYWEKDSGNSRAKECADGSALAA